MAFAPNIPPIQPHICVNGGGGALRFYENAFGAVTTMKHVGHVCAFNAPLKRQTP